MVGSSSMRNGCLSDGTLSGLGTCFRANRLHIHTTDAVDTGTTRVIGRTITGSLLCSSVAHPNNGVCAAHHCTTYVHSLSCCLQCTACTVLTKSPSVLSRQILGNLGRACGSLNIPVNTAIGTVRTVGRIATDLINSSTNGRVNICFSCVDSNLDWNSIRV